MLKDASPETLLKYLKMYYSFASASTTALIVAWLERRDETATITEMRLLQATVMREKGHRLLHPIVLQVGVAHPCSQLLDMAHAMWLRPGVSRLSEQELWQYSRQIRGGVMAGKQGRKSNGEGLVRLRKDGRWEARMSLSDGRTKSFYAKTKAEVLQKMRQAQHSVDKGLPVISDERQTLGAFLASWLEGIRPPQVRPKTYRSYEQLMRVHVIPALGKVPLSKLTAPRLQSFYAERLGSKRSPTTVRHIHAVLHTALEQAVKWGLVARNVSDLVHAPRMHRKEMLVLNAEQARMFLSVAHGDRLEALYLMALTTGMREGELLALSWRDVDLDAGYVQVHNTLQKLPGEPPIIAPTKTDYSRRKITLASTTLKALRDHRTRQIEERLALGSRWSDWELVFCTTIGTPLSGKNLLDRGLRPLLKRAGLPALRFHDLRHTCATLLLLQGVHPKVVSEMLGHSNVGFTLQTYSHVLPDMQKQATEAMDRLFG